MDRIEENTESLFATVVKQSALEEEVPTFPTFRGCPRETSDSGGLRKKGDRTPATIR